MYINFNLLYTSIYRIYFPGIEHAGEWINGCNAKLFERIKHSSIR